MKAISSSASYLAVHSGQQHQPSRLFPYEAKGRGIAGHLQPGTVRLKGDRQ